jgi:hypothetical protein
MLLDRVGTFFSAVLLMDLSRDRA